MHEVLPPIVGTPHAFGRCNFQRRDIYYQNQPILEYIFQQQHYSENICRMISHPIGHNQINITAQKE